MLTDQFMIEDPASWMEIPLAGSTLSVVDVYAAGLADPLRLEFDGDTLVSLRRFDASTQRSLEQLPAATVLPRYEVVIEPHEAAARWI